MNRVAAYEIIAAELAAYRELTFGELRGLVGDGQSRIVHGKDGMEYDLLTIVKWHGEPDGDIRVQCIVGEATWGSPHDSLFDEFVVAAR